MTSNKTTGSKRAPRSQTSRGSKATRQPWKPPQALETPEAPEGMRYRWIRTHIRNEDDKTNVHKRFQEGYEPVNPSEVEGYDLPTIEEGKHAGTVGVGGLILAKIPIETADERNAYYDQQAENQMNAVDNNLMRESDPRMPIHQERNSKVTFGASGKND